MKRKKISDEVIFKGEMRNVEAERSEEPLRNNAGAPQARSTEYGGVFNLIPRVLTLIHLTQCQLD